jgi:integrase/recombinase XerC
MGSVLIAPPAWSTELDRFDAWASGLPVSTRRLRNYHLRRFAVAVNKPPYDVTLDDLVGHLNNPLWAANTKAAARSSLRAFYKWATVSERIGRNPSEFLPSPRPPRGYPRPASEDAIDAALASADPRTALMIRIGSRAGLRAHEIAKVHSDHVVRREVMRQGKKKVTWTLIVKGKGSKVRRVPLPKSLAKTIAGAGGYVFPGKIEGHISAGYVTKLVSRALPRGVTAHMLRHRFASMAFSGDHNMRAVQELLGHASIATTQIYTAVDDEDLEHAAFAAA